MKNMLKEQKYNDIITPNIKKDLMSTLYNVENS